MTQDIRQQFAEIQKNIKWPVYLFDDNGKCIDSNNPDKIGEKVEVPDVQEGSILKTGQFQWIVAGNRGSFQPYYIALLGSDEASQGAMQLIKMVFQKQSYKLDSETILRHLLLGSGDYSYTDDEILEAGLHKDETIRIAVLDHRGAIAAEVRVIAENMIDPLEVIEVDRHHMAFVLKKDEDMQEILEGLVSELNTELLIPAKIGIGIEAEHWSGFAASFKTAKSALELGIKLKSQDNLHLYSQMLIFHLMDEIDTTSRMKYFTEFGKAFEILIDDEELIQTAIRFFENDLNITETSRQLYVHRNTLIYRLNKIEKLTGLDLRSFEDAVQFYMLMLIWQLNEY